MEKMKLNIQLFGASVSLTASATSSTDEAAITTNQNYINLAIRVQTTKPTWNGNKTAYYQVTTTSQNNGTQTGSKYYFSIGSSSGSGDKTFNVTLGPFDHNADGTLNDVSISVYVKITDSTNRTATKSVVMGTIPRASNPTLSSSSVNMNGSVVIYTNRYSNTFTHTITYQFGNASGTIGSNVTDNVTWNSSNGLTLNLANQVPTAVSGSGTITCYTYSGGTLVGTKSIGITLNVPSSVVPSITSRTLTENGTTPSNWNTYVKTKSKVRVQTSASGIYGSTITSIVTTLDGYTYSGADITSNFLNTSGSLACVTTITDSRGRQASASTTISVQDYYNPSFSIVQIQRCDENGNVDDNGAYCYFNFGGSVATCSNKNKGTYRIKYKLHSASTYTEIPAIATNVQSLSTSGFITDDGTQQGTKTQFSASDTYDFVFSIQDQFTTSTNTQTLDTGFDLMNFNANGKAMAIGKYSEAGANEELFEVGIPMIAEVKSLTTTNNAGYTTDQYGNLKHQRYNITDNMQFKNNNGDIKAQYNWENGHLSIGGNFTCGNFTCGNLTAQQLTSNSNIGTESIEISSTTPYIDFHHNSSTSDYTSRIIEHDAGILTMNNSLVVAKDLAIIKALLGFKSENPPQGMQQYSVTLDGSMFNHSSILGAVLIVVGGWTQSTTTQASLFLLSWSGYSMTFSALNTIIQGHGGCTLTRNNDGTITLDIYGNGYNMISLF